VLICSFRLAKELEITDKGRSEQSVNPDTTTFVVGKDECHIASIIEPMLIGNDRDGAGESYQGLAESKVVIDVAGLLFFAPPCLSDRHI
jgi:hypothetical protein